MKKIFNEYSGLIVIVFVISVLLLTVSNIKSIDNTTVNGSGIVNIYR